MGLRKRGGGPRNEKGSFISLPRPRKQELEKFYWQERLNMEKIGENFGVSGSTIHRWMREYNIPRRRTTETKMRRWNEKEIEKLKKVYPVSSRAEVEARFPDRTWQSIHWEANKKLGLKLRHTRNNYWKEHELQLLRENYKERTDEEMGSKLGRSAGSVQNKRRELGLEKRHMGDITKPSRELNLSDVDKAYLAGLIDGDGSIILSFHQYSYSNRKGIHSQISCAISARSANKEFVEEAMKMMGGRRTEPEENYYEVIISRQADILQFVEALLPYFRLKKKQAEIMIEFCRDRLKVLKDRRNAPYTKKSFELVRKMKEINNTPMTERQWK